MILPLSLWRVVILLIALTPLAFYLVAMAAAIRFVRRESRRVLPDFTPRVSLLKPVRGVDFASSENFASFCTQNFSNAPAIGSNRKVNNLAVLAREATHHILVQSDGDVRVGPNYLKEVV